MVNKNFIYILNPDYLMLNDIKRIILYSKRKVNSNSTENWYNAIHPAQAMIFSFFTFRRTLKDNLQRISDFFSISLDQAYNIIEPFIYNKTALKSVWKNNVIFFPKNVLISVSDVCDNNIKYRKIPVESLKCSYPYDVTARRINKFPLNFTFMLTNRCVTKCIYCYADTKTKVRNYIKTDRILELIDESKKLGIRNINLIGGEIFLHKDWDVILKKLKECGYEPNLISSKYPVNEDIINKLISLDYKNEIQVSFDSCDLKTLIFTLRVNKEYLPEIINSIRLLDKSGLNYHISTILTKINGSIENVKSLFDFIQTLQNLDSWRLRPATISLYKENMSEIILDQKRLMSIYNYIEKNIIPNYNKKIVLDKSFIKKTYYKNEGGSRKFEGAKCSALNSHMFVLPDGKVTICEQLYWNPLFIIGDLNYQSITQVWNSERVKQLISMKREDIQEKSPCYSCAIMNECFNNAKNRCWADILKAYGNKNWDYPDPRCEKAPKMAQYIGLK